MVDKRLREYMETIEKRKTFIVNILYFGLILALAIFLCRYAAPALMPFLIALVVALLLKPLIRFLREKLHVHKAVAGIVVSFLFYALIGFLLTIIGVRVFTSCKAFFMHLPVTYTQTIQPWLTELFNSIETVGQRFDPQSSVAFDMISTNITSALGEAVSGLSMRVVTWATNVTFKAPGFLLNTLITIIATVFFSIDWPVLREFVFRQFKPRTAELVQAIRTHLGMTLGRYIRSYALIMLITFVELSLGLSIVGISNPFGIAAVIAVFDILPVVGSGTVLLPWAAICLIQGAYPRAIGLLIVYLVIVIVRNIMEPKIVGDHVGLHPLVTLSSMVAGTYLFGPIGLLGLPVTLALLVSLNEAGVIHLYQNKPAVATPPPGEDGAENPPPEKGAPRRSPLWTHLPRRTKKKPE